DPRYGTSRRRSSHFRTAAASRAGVRKRRARMRRETYRQEDEQEEVMARADRGTRKRYVYSVVDSPVGKLTLVAAGDALAGILWANDRPGRVRLPVEAEDNEHPV